VDKFNPLLLYIQASQPLPSIIGAFMGSHGPLQILTRLFRAREDEYALRAASKGFQEMVGLQFSRTRDGHHTDARM